MERLVRKAQRGDKNAFMALIEKNQLALYRAAKAILHREEDVEDAVQETARRLRRRIQNGCTGCRYCMPCPAGVNIPGNFKVWNDYHMYRTYDHVKWSWEKELKEEEKAKNCIKCGKCETLCPQKLSIRDNLVQVQKDLDERIFK